MTDCTGWELTYDVLTPPKDASTPPGWEPALGVGGVSGAIVGNECNRISFGPFERGPIRLVLDVYGYNIPPEGCLKPNNTEVLSFAALHALWVDDDEVAKFLIDTFPEIPVYSAVIKVSNGTSTGPFADHVWEWGEKGQPSSQIHALDEGNRRAPEPILNLRLFWFPGDTKVSLLDFREEAQFPPTTNRPVYGRLAPPTVWSETASDIVAPGHWFANGEVTGQFQQYGDLECKQPL